MKYVFCVVHKLTLSFFDVGLAFSCFLTFDYTCLLHKKIFVCQFLNGSEHLISCTIFFGSIVHRTHKQRAYALH